MCSYVVVVSRSNHQPGSNELINDELELGRKISIVQVTDDLAKAIDGLFISLRSGNQYVYSRETAFVIFEVEKDKIYNGSEFFWYGDFIPEKALLRFHYHDGGWHDWCKNKEIKKKLEASRSLR